MNMIGLAKPEHAERMRPEHTEPVKPERAEQRDARGDESRSHGVSVLSDRVVGRVAMVTGDAPLNELARHAAGSVDLLYCGGVLHRMSRTDKANLVTACFRVLKHLGSIRIATTDLDQVVQGYLFDWTDGQGTSRTQTLNAAFRQPGMQFLYGEEELTKLLTHAGFADIRRFGAGASPHRRFWNLESDLPYALVLEATKP